MRAKELELMHEGTVQSHKRAAMHYSTYIVPE